jgi:hypothetical protein
MVKWAWEFLRRSDDYRRRWEQLTTTRGHREIEETEDGRRTHWRSREEVLRVEFRVCAGHSTLDPADGRPPLFEGAEIVYEIVVQPEATKPPLVLIQFDASLPVAPQLDGARRLLHKRAKELRLPPPRNVRPRVGKFRTYLQLLDFHALVASDKEIGQHLYPGTKGERLRNLIRDDFAAARRWQDDYLFIALHAPANS